jgi:hypothetical protein
MCEPDNVLTLPIAGFVQMRKRSFYSKACLCGEFANEAGDVQFIYLFINSDVRVSKKRFTIVSWYDGGR